MSLADKVKDHIRECFKEGNYKFAAMTMEQRLEAAFYAGAEAIQQSRTDTMGAYWEIQAEIDRFKGQK